MQSIHEEFFNLHERNKHECIRECFKNRPGRRLGEHRVDRLWASFCIGSKQWRKRHDIGYDIERLRTKFWHVRNQRNRRFRHNLRLRQYNNAGQHWINIKRQRHRKITGQAGLCEPARDVEAAQCF